MDYYELKIKVKDGRIEDVCNKLFALGFHEYALNDPKEFDEMIANLGETEWYDEDQISDSWKEGKDEASVTLYFASDEEVKKAKEAMEPELDELAESLEITGHKDSEWKEKWKDYFYPAKVSEKFFVIPSWWEEQVDVGDAIPIFLDPGMAFGTGTHETTSLTLKLMEEYMEEGMSVLDVGTGSGILAIAAVKLGASSVLGIDIDPDAVETAKKNLEINGASHIAEAVEGDLTKGVDFEADMIAANLLTDLVIRFCPDAAAHLEPGKLFISSGILGEKKDRVIEALQNSGFEVLTIKEDGDWCAMAAKKVR